MRQVQSREKAFNTKRLALSQAVTVALATLMTSQPAQAQTAEVKPAAVEAEVAKVLIVGTRKSQQSSIEGKKNAATAVDMIVAEDVGSFPDRNVAEAISRIAGVSLERGDFGEGRTVDVRGNGPDLTRVEIDGMGVIAAGGSDMNGGGGARGVELRELSSDLIKSVTVAKGATPDMTEGSLGGGILIKTRNGLDFKERYLSARLSGTRSSLNDKWTPNTNFVYADKFLKGRLGVIANITQTELRNEGHFSQNATSGVAGYVRLADFDNSPEKTFTFQPQTLNLRDPNTLLPLHRAPLSAGGTLDFETPQQLLTKAAGAATKAECFSAFPAPGQADLSRMTNDAARSGALNYRANALISCLNQWNDYTPSLLRSVVKRNHDKRLNSDLRVDFKVTDKLSVYAKYVRNRRTVLDEFLTFDRGTPGIGFGAYLDVNGKLVATPGSTTSIFGGYTRTGTGLSEGVGALIVPGSVVVDKTHHVTALKMSEAGFFIDNIYNEMISNNSYTQAGGEYRNGSLKAEFMLSSSEGEFHRGDTRLNGIGYTYGQAELKLQPGGAWGYTFPDGVDQGNPAPYAQFNPRATPTATSLSRSALLQFTPKLGESGEKQAKIDLQWQPDLRFLPFLGTMKFGGQYREYDNTGWSSVNGYVAQSATKTTPAVLVPASYVRISITGCEQAAVTGAAPCPAYGFAPGTGINSRRGGYTLNRAQFTDFINKVMSTKRTTPFFGDAAKAPQGLGHTWAELDVPKAIEVLQAQNLNHDCSKACTGSDGKLYTQPSTGVSEKITSGYWMTDFDFSTLPYTDLTLPWGMELNGNFGWRWVRSNVAGRGQVSFISITKTPQYNPAAPEADAGISTLTMIKDTSITKTTTDIMPMFNLMFWPLKDTVVLRYTRNKTIARQPVWNLYPTGNCTYDERNLDLPGNNSGDEFDMTCKGDFGNPGLKPTTNINQNLSLEWYPNKDMMFTAALFKFKGIIGGTRRVSISNDKLFEGSSAVDPVTGVSLAGLEFTHPTLENGEPSHRTGWEIGTKLAFSGLPGLLRYTGLDANISKTKPKILGELMRDPLSGDYQDPAFVPRHSWNASLWYDDGAFSARAALQVVAQKFTAIGPWFANGANRNYPMLGASNVVAPPWNPGSATFENATRYLDLKVGYKFNPKLEVYAEMRNALRSQVVRGNGAYNTFENGVQSVNEFVYTGSRASFGVNISY